MGDPSALSVNDVAEMFGLPTNGILNEITRNPTVVRAMVDVRNGIRPEQAAARYDLPWNDPEGLDWKVLLFGTAVPDRVSVRLPLPVQVGDKVPFEDGHAIVETVQIADDLRDAKCIVNPLPVEASHA